MNKLLSFMAVALLSTNLFAYTDFDMDGVDDSIDKCPNTPFTDLVDINGCSKKSIATQKVSLSHYDIIIGASYAGSNFASLNQTDVYSSTIQADYYYKNFSLQASTSYYKSTGTNYSNSGMNDSFIGAAYNLRPSEKLSVRLGVGLLLPTYDTSLNNNNTDYTATANLSYKLGKASVFGGAGYTIVNDDDVLSGTNPIYYQNTPFYSAGLGYYFGQNFYLSASYNVSKSIYKGVDDIKTASAYAYYSLSAHTFLMFNYAYGLSDSASDNAASVKLGFYF